MKSDSKDLCNCVRKQVTNWGFLKEETEYFQFRKGKGWIWFWIIFLVDWDHKIGHGLMIHVVVDIMCKVITIYNLNYCTIEILMEIENVSW